MTKGRKPDPADPRSRRLQSIVEGLAISAGLTRTPDVYIVPSQVPNAFASGMNEKSAFIGVTEGLLNMLDDQELTGVIGHEMAHIAHRDILVSQLAVSLVSAILMLSAILSRIAFFGGRSSGRRSRDGEGGNAGELHRPAAFGYAPGRHPIIQVTQ
jgi:heat shock protein HtpX